MRACSLPVHWQLTACSLPVHWQRGLEGLLVNLFHLRAIGVAGAAVPEAPHGAAAEALAGGHASGGVDTIGILAEGLQGMAAG